MAIDTSGLSGYALEYANAFNGGASDVEAHAAATSEYGTGGSGSGTSFAAFDGNGNVQGYQADSSAPHGWTMTGYVPQYNNLNPIIPTAPQPRQTQIQTQQQGLLQKYQNILDKLQNQPQYTPIQPDYSAIMPMATGPAATSDPSQTTFVPTVNYHNRVNAQRQQIDNATNQANAANLNAWNAGQSQQAQELQSLLSILPYYETTAAEKAAAERETAANALKAQTDKAKLEQEQRQWQAEYDLEQQKLAASKLGKLASGGSSGKGLTPYQQYQVEKDQNQIDGYTKDRLDTYIISIANQYSDPQKMINYVTANNSLNSKFKSAVLQRIRQRTTT